MKKYFERLLNIYKGVGIAVLVVLCIIVAFSPVIIGIAVNPSFMLLLFITIPVITALIKH